MDITELTVHELQEKIKNKELTITEITKAYVDRIKEKEPEVQAFITELTEAELAKMQSIIISLMLAQLYHGMPQKRICIYSLKDFRLTLLIV